MAQTLHVPQVNPVWSSLVSSWWSWFRCWFVLRMPNLSILIINGCPKVSHKPPREDSSQNPNFTPVIVVKNTLKIRIRCHLGCRWPPGRRLWCAYLVCQILSDINERSQNGAFGSWGVNYVGQGVHYSVLSVDFPDRFYLHLFLIQSFPVRTYNMHVIIRN